MYDNLTQEQAIALAQTGWWKDKDAKLIVDFQLFESRLCMDFSDFHGAVEEALGRPVWSHEFADAAALRREYLRETDPPTFEQIMGKIPEAARIIVVKTDEDEENDEWT